MSVETYDPSAANISVTAAALAHLSQHLQHAAAAGIRISVKQSGCTGYRYVTELAQQMQPGDLCLQPSAQLQLYIDAKALPMLRGTQIDLKQEGLNQTLVFNNPNAQDYCGCGESFNVKPNATGKA